MIDTLRHNLMAFVCRTLRAAAFLGLAMVACSLRGAETGEVRIESAQGSVKVMPAGATEWVVTQAGQTLHPGWRLKTEANSRVVLRWSDQSVVSYDARSEVEILTPEEPQGLAGLSLIKGILSFFHRDKPSRIRVLTRGAVAGVRGTEFVLEVDDTSGTEHTTISLINGEVEFTNEHGVLLLGSHEQAVAELGKPPARTAGFIANNVLQWCLYYPAVLDLRDLSFAPDEELALKESLMDYRKGNLLAALAHYPSDRHPGSESEQIYRAALFLTVGQVAETEGALRELDAAKPSRRAKALTAALRQLIAAVKRDVAPRDSSVERNELSTEMLAASYYEQSRNNGDDSLRMALDLARQAAANSPDFGFAWARVAELEFGFGRTAAAKNAVERALELCPQNAQALALEGFLLAAQNCPKQAIELFNRALAVDSALGNAWLGRGLCRISLGDTRGGRKDLLIAAATEPQRALLRSYLGKAYADLGEDKLATHELNRARELDRNDPTAWLYCALLQQQQNNINEAIGDLETAQDLNDNRSLFRSRLLLDEDRAVKSANLAAIYRDAGMDDVSLREAAKAVTYDYANDSAHLFLSDSFNELRDPTRFNLRYETVWFNELLLANLLSPVGGGRLSQHVSQQEYSRLFESDGFHLANDTTYRSDNESVRQLTSQFGTTGWTSYSLDLDYDYQKGVRPNNDLSSIEWYSTIKQQITPHDTALVLVKYEDYHSGDNFQYYEPTNARPHFRFDEYQHPIVVGAWNHEWAPGINTLLLGGRLENEQHFTDKAAPQLVYIPTTTPLPISDPFDVQYHNQLEIYTVEINQLLRWKQLTLSAGGRYQSGTFDTTARLYNPAIFSGLFDEQSTNAISSSDHFERITGYGYLTAELPAQFWLTGGFAYEDVTYPRNFRNPPISPGEDHRSQLGPKAAVVWEVRPEVVLRGTYTKSLGGVSLDESYRLEPTSLAGFPQTFRSLISESIVGSVSAPEYQTYGAALDLKFPTGTYAGVQFQRLESRVDRTIGLFEPTSVAGPGFITPFITKSTLDQLDYGENTVSASLNQLLGKRFVVGTEYKWTDAKLHDLLPRISTIGFPTADQHLHSELHQITGYLLFNHPSGFFARADVSWYHQNNSGYSTPMPGDDFVQENIYAGYRFWHRHAEVTMGILNLSDQDYHLSPLTVYMELPRQRSFFARLKFVF